MERYDIRVNVWGDVSGPQYEWETVKAEDGEWVKYADAQATVEALQAQYSELLEALDCVLAERPLPSGEYVHRVSCSGDRRKPAGTVGISCSCRVGQQQVKALQAKVSELQGIADEKCRCFLERAEQSEKQLTRRTAELERVRGELATYKETKHDAI